MDGRSCVVVWFVQQYNIWGECGWKSPRNFGNKRDKLWSLIRKLDTLFPYKHTKNIKFSSWFDVGRENSSINREEIEWKSFNSFKENCNQYRRERRELMRVVVVHIFVLCTEKWNECCEFARSGVEKKKNVQSVF